MPVYFSSEYIRFSRDRSPYNLHMTAFLSPEGSKDKSPPGFFFRFGARNAEFLANKQFYAMTGLPFRIILEPDLKKQTLDTWKACRPLNEFLMEALE